MVSKVEDKFFRGLAGIMSNELGLLASDSPRSNRGRNDSIGTTGTACTVYGLVSSIEVDSRLLTIDRLLRELFLRSRQLVNFLEKSKLLQDLGSAT